MTVSREQLRAVLLGWAEEFAPDVSVRQVDWLVGEIAGLLPTAPGAAPVRPLTSKPGASVADARAIAARLEATAPRPSSPLQVACTKCGAGPAERCRSISVSGMLPPKQPHAARVRAAGGAQ